MKHLFVPYELAVKLKEKGFIEKSLANFSGYTNIFTDEEFTDFEIRTFSEFSLLPNGKDGKIKVRILPAYLWQQVIDWLEYKHGFFFERLFENINKEEVFMLWRNGDIEKNHTHKSLEKSIEEALKLI